LAPAEETLEPETWRQPSEKPESQSWEVEAMVEEKRVEEAFVNVWRAVQALALPRLSPMVLAVLPV